MEDPTIDDLTKWRSILWEEYKEKTALEWKFSYSLWAALLAIASVSLADKYSNPKLEFNPRLLVVAVIIIVTIHGLFLVWTQIRLKKNRISINKVDKKIRKKLQLEEFDDSYFGKTLLGKVPSIIQIVISVLICVLVLMLLKPVSG